MVGVQGLGGVGVVGPGSEVGGGGVQGWVGVVGVQWVGG